MAIHDLRPPGIEERAKTEAKLKEQALVRASKYHQTFVQNDAGAKLLEEWIGLYMFGGFTANDASTTELAKAEARREFVSMIVSNINLSKRGEQ